MSIEITPLLPFLLGLTVLVLVLSAVRSARLFGRVLLGALLLLRAGLNPAEARTPVGSANRRRQVPPSASGTRVPSSKVRGL